MALIATLSSLLLNAVAVALLGWTAWRALQAREQPSAEPFIAILAMLTLWGVFSFVAELPSVPGVSSLQSVLELGEIGIAMIIPGLWTIYVLSYTGRGTGLTWRRVALLAGIALPVLLGGIVLAVAPPEAPVEQLIAPLVGTELLYLFALFLYATYLLVDLGGNHARVSNTHVAILTVGVFAPYLVSLVGNNTSMVANTTVGLLLSGGLLAVAVRRYPVMTGFPKADYIARTRVVETLQEAVVVLDWDDHVLDVNETAVEAFGGSVATMIGEPIRTVIDGLEQTELSAGATGTVGLQSSMGRRQFQFSVSSVTDSPAGDGDDPVARTVLFRDVTEQQTREQRLAVLNRILRHNVRSDLDVILAYADHIDDDGIQTSIRDSATELLELSKKIRESEELMTASTDTPEPVDLTEVAESVVNEFETSECSGEISLDCPEEASLSSHRFVLRQLLAELVENALVHSDKETPRVDVRVRQEPDTATRITVADNGPGLPEREQEILAAGTETQLKHARGIGLWFVSWAVTQLGGELSFHRNDPEGSVVTVQLYSMTSK
ncbi:ATP-binding protein [Haloarcula sp. S1CR25-12]|uniref:histidine kinase n=1 Tax=Haloarcula saliterrae TaxID=2950534 RepID=A0ABU2FF92_9EURY|nr:ATP-binding protein [Haloarcula sp. S1CR25-12]MDS0260919.1 ATP-binding protein [Haloarcula sp. S1CR25-12]